MSSHLQLPHYKQNQMFLVFFKCSKGEKRQSFNYIPRFTLPGQWTVLSSTALQYWSSSALLSRRKNLLALRLINCNVLQSIYPLSTVQTFLFNFFSRFCSSVSGQDRPNLQDKRSQVQLFQINHFSSWDRGQCQCWGRVPPTIELDWKWVKLKFEVIGGVGFQVVVPGPPLSALIGLHSVAPREADQLHYPQHRITSQRSLISLISHQINWALPSGQSQQWREMSSEQFQAQLLQWKRVEKKCAKIAEV